MQTTVSVIGLWDSERIQAPELSVSDIAEYVADQMLRLFRRATEPTAPTYQQIDVLQISYQPNRHPDFEKPYEPISVTHRFV
jgi:hypothetical protein